ncbi:MAG: hypothetical protein ACT4QG_09530 [Sporichthyaceae bacterium]
MARHRAPDVASPLHGVHPTGSGRPRHAAGPAQVGPGETRIGRHRGASAAERALAPVREPAFRETPVPVELPPPSVVAEPQLEPVELHPVPLEGAAASLPVEPTVIELAPARDLAPQPAPPPALSPAQPYAEVVAWAGFASLVAAGVVSAGQGPRAEGIWTLSILGAGLTTSGLGWLAVRRQRARRADGNPQ